MERRKRRQSLQNFENYRINRYLTDCETELGLTVTNINKERAKTNEREPRANALRSCAWKKMGLPYNPPKGGARRSHKKRRTHKKRRATRRR